MTLLQEQLPELSLLPEEEGSKEPSILEPEGDQGGVAVGTSH